MTIAFNVVRFRVKPGREQAFIDAHRLAHRHRERAPRPAALPVFLAYALHDAVVPIDHALNLVKAAQVHGLDVGARASAQAEHGFALRALEGTQGR